ncbi:glycosyltransferase [Alicyclobacillus sp. ALC3]|uniref:glycosyltransferase n=1 Tax=Alicyclobacillus sp. ALC3 TaxID=2796143 RepID=UPI002378F061|nr:glycosyltransferase [Alicyclobacillus sp. ALC3]WDL95153.1 glycosyltransferase [Alicyclobacillus sp. ALC3]
MANERLTLRLVVDKLNAQNVEQLLHRIKSRYSARLFTYECDPFNPRKNLNWVNQHLQVDAWLVPYVGLELALELKQPFILCLHDLVHEHFRSVYVPRFPDYFSRFDKTVQSMTKEAAAVVFSSNFTRTNEGRLLQLPDSKTEMIRLAAPTEEYEQMQILDEATLRHRYRLSRPYLVYPSAIRLHKNHPRLIEAFLRYLRSQTGCAATYHLVLTDHYMNSPLKSEISSLLRVYRDVANHVIFVGRIPASDLPSLFKYAVGTVVPTLFEGSFPFQILESLLMDTPVAFSRIEPIQELLADISVFPSFDPCDLDEMEHSIADLFHPQPALFERQQAVIKPLLTRTWVHVAKEYLALAARVTPGNSPNHSD